MAMNPRVNVVLEKPVYDELKRLAGVAGVSVSHKARDLMVEAMELFEDCEVSRVLREREANHAPSVPWTEVKRRLKRRRAA